MGGHSDRPGRRRDEHHDAFDADLLCLWRADYVMQPLAYGDGSPTTSRGASWN